MSMKKYIYILIWIYNTNDIETYGNTSGDDGSIICKKGCFDRFQ